MICLKKILLESKENSYCWLTPTGKVIRVHNTHGETARKIFPNSKDPIMEMWKLGYQRVTYMYDGSLLVNNELKFPTRQQLNILIDIAYDGNHDRIVYDSGENEKIIWTINDILQ